MNYPAVYALWRIQQAPFRGWLDPVVLAALLAVVPPFLPGMVVQLNDRRHAIVVKTHEDAPCYPEVQILEGMNLMSRANVHGEREVVDLATTRGLSIESVDGFDVSEFLYGAKHVSNVRAPVPQQTLFV